MIEKKQFKRWSSTVVATLPLSHPKKVNIYVKVQTLIKESKMATKIHLKQPT